LRQDYEVKLDLFEGPLDLLLYLVHKDEVDIADISVARVTEQYLSYLDLMRELNLNVAAEYLHMASTLVRLKARELLPSAEVSKEEAEEDGIYTREQLIQQLLEYRKFKEAAKSLRMFEAAQAGSFPRGTPDEVEADASAPEDSIGNISVFDLLAAFRRVLEQAAEEKPSHVVKIDNAKLDDRIEYVLELLAEDDEVPFERLFADDRRRIVLVVTFMAILELVKMQEIVFRQEENFAKIFVCRRPSETREKFEDFEDEPQDDEAQGSNNGE